MQDAPQLIPLPKDQKRRETRMSSFSKDHEIEPRCIMCLKRSYLVFRTNTFFLLPIIIKGGKSTIVQTQAFIDLGAFACFINNELVWQHNLALVEKVTPMVIKMNDGWNLSSRLVTHETKVLTITIGSLNSKVVFNVISSSTNPIIIGLSSLIFHNLWVNGKTKSLHFESINKTAQKY